MDDTTSEEDCFTDSSDGRLTGRKLFASEPIAGSRTTGAPTAVQDRVLLQLEQLADASDWRGVAALEREGEEVAAAVRTAMPSHTAYVYSTLGSAYQTLEDFSKAIKYHTQHLAMAKEMGDRAGEGRAHGNLGTAYQSQGDFSMAIDHQKQHLTIAKEVSYRAGEGMAASSPAASSSPVMGDSPVASSLLPVSEFSARSAPSHELQADWSIRSARSGRCRNMSAGMCTRAHAPNAPHRRARSTADLTNRT
jgi:tetratricopeptide (TPR) repeat protein